MKITGADIYSENIYTGEIKNHPSLRKACSYIKRLPKNAQEETLLCIGNWNLDYIKQNETAQEYYQRMLKMVAEI